MNYRIDCTEHLQCRNMDAVDQEYIAMRNEADAMNGSFDVSFARAAKNWGAMDWFSREVELGKAQGKAMEINAHVNEELCKLARVIAGVNRSTYKHETKAQLIGAACAGVVDGLRERVGVVLSRDRLAETVTRAVVARNE